ncbi:MAG: glycine cleavage system aminomethyltransferase GcvT [Bradyrhizobiaceae bacterium]|nr:glycine cleavage system aminomethyltransferase GcvT [Bradyrhizobiaceae bacterium]
MKHTAFHDIHVAAGAKMVEFAGFHMPIQYPTGILEEHRIVRSGVGVFDVSHMGEFDVAGADALAFIQSFTINDASKLQPGKAQYSAMCMPDGGIVDDLLVYCIDEQHYMLVVNGANIDKDWAWVEKHAAGFENLTIQNQSDEISLLAVQGPLSTDTLQSLTSVNLADIPYYSFVKGALAGVDMIISRTGYTGEVGYELYFRADADTARSVVDQLFAAGAQHNIAWIGLGARDTLRLEKGYCLYGNDIDETTNPLEAGLGWITKLAKGEFTGKEAIAQVKQSGPTRKLVGFVMQTEKLLPRKGYPIVVNGNVVGTVTSGGMSANLGTGIGLGYVTTDLTEPGTAIEISARNTTFPALVAKLPMV